MKKANYILAGTAFLVVLFVSACGSSAAPATQQAVPPVENQTAPSVETQPIQQPPSFAPACTGASSCAVPVVPDTDVSNTYCVVKHPYQNIPIPPGITYEVLDKSGEFKCADSGTVVDGKNVISCTGKQLWTYDLKLTNLACGATNLATGTGQCQDGFGYDAAQNCCAPLNANNASVTIKVNIGACP